MKNPKVEALVQHITALDYGSTITHFEISRIAEEQQGTPTYYRLVRAAKRDLLKLGRMMECVTGTGYRVVEPDDYTDQAVKQYQKGLSRFTMGNKIISCAPTEHMTQEGLQAHREISDRARRLYATVAGGCTELKLLARKPSPLEPQHIARR